MLGTSGKSQSTRICKLYSLLLQYLLLYSSAGADAGEPVPRYYNPYMRLSTRLGTGVDLFVMCPAAEAHAQPASDGAGPRLDPHSAGRG